MKVLIVPDSFKGSLTSEQVCESIKKGLLDYNSEITVDCIPFSDGGEGFTECLEKACSGRRVNVKCHNIYFNEIEGYFTVINNNTAVIASSTASGLLKRKQIMLASSYGTGEIIKSAYEMGYKNIILGLGGTGCCDGGIGALTALGVEFYDENQNIIANPKANDMNYIFGVSFRNSIRDINITYACDVENTYFGKNGAAYVFAPQKGARKTDVEELDEGLKRVNAFFCSDISDVKGAGAGGGICGGLYAVFGGEIKSGFDILSLYTELESKIQNYDIIITGEGKTDNQTLMGKLPYRISELAKKYGKKCIIISGTIEDVTLGDRMFSLVDENTTAEEAINNAFEILAEKAKSILK